MQVLYVEIHLLISMNSLTPAIQISTLSQPIIHFFLCKGPINMTSPVISFSFISSGLLLAYSCFSQLTKSNHLDFPPGFLITLTLRVLPNWLKSSFRLSSFTSSLKFLISTLVNSLAWAPNSASHSGDLNLLTNTAESLRSMQFIFQRTCQQPPGSPSGQMHNP